MKIQKSFESQLPSLYIVATPIGNLNEMTPRAIDILHEVDIIAAEDTRNTKKLLQYFDIHTKIVAHHKFNEKQSARGLIQLLQDGKSIALVSDAGYPLISDPGSFLCNEVIQKGFPVIPISGSNALLNGLVASGLSLQHFLFYGFLDSQQNQRKKALESLKMLPYTLVFYEAPHRFQKMLTDCLEILGNRHICIAKELTKKHETFIRGTLQDILQNVQELKGELVIMIEGYAKELVEIDYEHLITETYERIQENMSTKEAIKLIAKKYNVSKNELYSKFHEHQNE